MRYAGTDRRNTWVGQFERDLLSVLPQLRRFARYLTKDGVEADDLCQMTMERALVRRDQHRADASLNGWMFKIARNCWIDEVRGQRHMSGFYAPEGINDQDATASTVGFDLLTAMSLRQALNDLPPDQREVVVLVWVEGLSYREASEVLDIPIGTLTSRLFRARKKLIATMEAV